MLSAATSLIILEAISFSNQSVLVGVDHLANSLLDVSSHSKPATRALALSVVDDEMTSDLSQLIHDGISKRILSTPARTQKAAIPEAV